MLTSLKSAESSCPQSCSWGEDAERHGAGFPSSSPHACSLNSKELVLQLLVSQLSMVRSVKVTLPSASIRMTVLVLKVQGHSDTNNRCSEYVVNNLLEFSHTGESQE